MKRSSKIIALRATMLNVLVGCGEIDRTGIATRRNPPATAIL